MNDDEIAFFQAWADRHNAEEKHRDAEARLNVFPDDLSTEIDRHEQRLNSYLGMRQGDRKLLTHYIYEARQALLNSDEHKAKNHILYLRKQLEQADELEYAHNTSRQLSQSAKQRADDIKEERQPHWQAWQDEADRVRADAVTKISISEIARRVKKNLNLTDSVETIRKRIK